MKLIEKIVSRATENTLLQLDRAILICLFLVLVVDVMAVCLVLQSNLEILGLILLVIDFFALVFVFYLRFISSKVIFLMLNDAINLKLYVDMFRVQSEKSIKIYRATYQENFHFVKGQVSFLQGDFQSAKENLAKINFKKVWKTFRGDLFLRTSSNQLLVSIHLQDARDIAFFEEQLSKAPDSKGGKAKLVPQT